MFDHSPVALLSKLSGCVHWQTRGTTKSFQDRRCAHATSCMQSRINDCIRMSTCRRAAGRQSARRARRRPKARRAQHQGACADAARQISWSAERPLDASRSGLQRRGQESAFQDQSLQDLRKRYAATQVRAVHATTHRQCCSRCGL